MKEDLDNLLERLKGGEDVGTVLTEVPRKEEAEQKKPKHEKLKNKEKEQRMKLFATLL